MQKNKPRISWKEQEGRQASDVARVRKNRSSAEVKGRPHKAIRLVRGISPSRHPESERKECAARKTDEVYTTILKRDDARRTITAMSRGRLRQA